MTDYSNHPEMIKQDQEYDYDGIIEDAMEYQRAEALKEHQLNEACIKIFGCPYDYLDLVVGDEEEILLSAQNKVKQSIK